MPRSPNDPRNRHGRPRRTPPTIDLKATEVKASPTQRSEPAAPPSEPASPGAASSEVPPATSGLVPDQAATTPPHGDAAGTVVADATGTAATAASSAPVEAPVADAKAAGTTEAAPASAATSTARPRRAKVWPAAEAPRSDAPIPSAEPSASAEAVSPPAQPESPPAPSSADASPPPPRAAEPRRSGTGGLIAAGLLGGLVGAGATLLGSTLLPFGPASTPESGGQREGAAALERRIAGLEQAQAGLADQARAAREAAQASNARVEAALRAAPASGAPAVAPTPEAAGQSQAALQALTGRLDALEADARNRGGAAEQALAALRGQVEEQARRLAEASNTLGTRLSALDGVVPRLNAAETELKAQTGARAETNAAYDRRFTAQDQRLATQDQRLNAQDQRLDALARQVAETGPEAVRAGLRVVLSDHIVQLLREGKGYAETLAALKRLNVDQATLAPLEPFAASGAPTLDRLQDEFKPLADRMIAASRPAGAQGSSLSDRLWRMADQIVTVRTVGDPSQDDLPGLIARIEAALERDAAGEAAAAWDALPESARRASEEWGRRLKARAAAEAAARQISARALAGLEAPTR